MPSVVNAAAPSASVASRPIIFSPGTCAPNSGTPAMNSRTIDRTSTISVEPTAPPAYAAHGIGVVRTRLRMPVVRSEAKIIAVLLKQISRTA